MVVAADSVPGWRFKPKTKDDIIVDPFQEEFFKTESSGTTAESFLREIIQNSLDAKSNADEPVKIRIAVIRNCSFGDDQSYRFFIHGLENHIHAPDNGIIDKPVSLSDIDYIVIEDYNTTGLEGDPQRSDPPEDHKSGENFFFFWRNYGRSGKGDQDRGRWGLGKTVFSAMSRINTFFGLTIRKSDRQALLLGQSVMNTHRVGDGFFMPYGRFGRFRDAEGERYFALPVEDNEVIQKFRKIFQLQRISEPGLSVVVPFPDTSITPVSLRTGVVRQFFYPIMSGALEVSIEDKSEGQPVILSRETVRNYLALSRESLFEENGESDDIDLIKLFDFTDTALRLKPEEYIILKTPENLKDAPRWTKNLFSDIPVEDLRKKFDQGAFLGFRIPIKVQRKNHQPELSWFRLFIQKDPEIRTAETHFIREGITITGIKTFRQKGIRGMVVIDEKPLTTMIGDAENPAHTEWQKESKRFRDRYDHGPYTLGFIKNSLREIFGILQAPATGENKEILGDIFFFETPKEVQEKEKTKDKDQTKKGDDAEDPPDLDIQPKIKPAFLAKIKGGIRISSNPESPKKISSVRIQFAYAVGKGSALSKYQSPDFDLSRKPIEIRGNGFTIKQNHENILEIEITEDQFDLSVSGFDEHRDLVVDSKYAERSE